MMITSVQLATALKLGIGPSFSTLKPIGTSATQSPAAATIENNDVPLSTPLISAAISPRSMERNSPSVPER